MTNAGSCFGMISTFLAIVVVWRHFLQSFVATFIQCFVLWITLSACSPSIKLESIVTNNSSNFDEAVQQIMRINQPLTQTNAAELLDTQSISSRIVTDSGESRVQYNPVESLRPASPQDLESVDVILGNDNRRRTGIFFDLIVRDYALRTCLQITDVLKSTMLGHWQPIVGLGSGYELFVDQPERTVRVFINSVPRTGCVSFLRVLRFH